MLDTPKALQESIARCTSIRSSLRSQRPILSGRRGGKDVSRPCDQGGGRERKVSMFFLLILCNINVSEGLGLIRIVDKSSMRD